MKKRGKLKKDGILAEGEATGHKHRVVDQGAQVFTEVYGDTSLMLVTGDKTEVIHDEHGTVVLPPKKSFRVDKVLEYDHFKEEARPVSD